MPKLDLSRATLSLGCRPNLDGTLPCPRILIVPRGIPLGNRVEPYPLFAGRSWTPKRTELNQIADALGDKVPVTITCTDLPIAVRAYSQLLDAAGVAEANRAFPTVVVSENAR